MVSSSEKKRLIQEFRVRLRDILNTEERCSDYFILRWLEARDLNLDKAEELIRNSFKWRAENGIDSLVEKKFDSYFTKKYPVTIGGMDRNGNPVLTFHFGKWDVKQAVNDGKGDEWGEYILAVYETISQVIRDGRKSNENDDNRCIGFSSVIDFEGYSYSQVLSMKVLQLCMTRAMDYEAHYPGLMIKTICINCPRIFSMLWKVLKPLLSQKTQEAILIRGSNRKEWEVDVRNQIDPKYIKIQYGGTLAD